MAELEDNMKLINEVFVWKCPICGKEIKALHRNQTLFKANNHILAHQLKGENSKYGLSFYRVDDEEYQKEEVKTKGGNENE